MIRITHMLKFFGALCLIFITGVASSTDENLSQTSQCIQPINYTISLEIQNANLIVNSTVALNMSCEQQYIRLKLGRHCNITVDVQTAISYNLFSSRWDAIQTNIINSRFKHVDISLTESKRYFKDLLIRKERKLPLKSGMYMIYSVCNCTLKEVATVDTYISQTETKEFLILSRIPNEWMFPYWENPATKARFTIQIKHKDTDKALSIMPIDYQTFEYQTRKFQTVFFTTFLISTHSVAFIIIPNEYTTNTTTESNVAIISSLEMKNDTSFARTLIFNITMRIRNMWDDIIPRSHVSYVLLSKPSTQYENIVTPGFVFLSEVNSIYDSEVDSIIKEREVTCFIARNILQEMFSDWLGIFEQSDSWFLEGFLTVYGVYIWDESLLKSIVVQTRRNILDYIEAFSKNDFPIQEIPSRARNSTLRKMWREIAFSTFYMLNGFVRNTLFNSMFEKAVHSYSFNDNTSTNAYNKLSILDKLWYWNFEASFNNSTRFSTVVIKKLITSWTAQVGYPILQVNRHDNKRHLIVMVEDCFDVDRKKPCKPKWWIPIKVFKILDSKVIATHSEILPRNWNYISLVLNESVSAIISSIGVRVNYDRQSWKDIAFFLKTVDPKIAYLSDVNLAHILDDAFYFLVQNPKYNKYSDVTNRTIFFNDLDIFLDIASSIFQVKTSYIAWYPIFIALENMSKIFPLSNSVVFIIKDKLLYMLNKLFQNISYTHSTKNTVSNQLYHEVLKWICILKGSQKSKCNEHVNKIFNWHYEDTAHNKLLPSWQKWIYCRKLMLETYDPDVTLTIFNIYRTQKKEKEFFELLPCFKQFENLPSFLDYLDRISLLQKIVNDEKQSVLVSLLFNIVASYSNNESALAIILSGKYLERKLGIKVVSEMTIINYIINNIYSKDVLLKITNEEFLSKYLNINSMEPFVLDVIKKKADSRRLYLDKMQDIIRFKPKLIFTDQRTTKEVSFS